MSGSTIARAVPPVNQTPAAPPSVTSEVPSTENAETQSTTPTETETEDAAQIELSPQEERRQQLIAADRLYEAGDRAAAERIYRQVKEPFETEQIQQRQEAFSDPDQLSPAGGVYWRLYQEGIEQERQLESKILAPLELLVENEPAFIPGHIAYVRALIQYDRVPEALEVFERATALYPDEPELIRAAVEIYDEHEKWLEASLVARQFALLNPEHPEAEGFDKLADKKLERYQRRMRARLRENAFANAITGAIGFALTGNLFGPLTALESTILLMQGEANVGAQVSENFQRQLDLIDDPEVLNYVREMGEELALYTGRDEFDYEFFVIKDDRLNAFALPGGKIFVNAGAIVETDSEAELAGLLAHELAHAVLSHGFQLVTRGNLLANVSQFIPYGGTAANLIVLDYSRDMERQADALGTRILAHSHYAADGLYHLMLKLEAEEKASPPAWLSTHPDTSDRVRNIEAQIISNGYNRYAYEGISRHEQIKQRVAELLEPETETEATQEEANEETESNLTPFQTGF